MTPAPPSDQSPPLELAPWCIWSLGIFPDPAKCISQKFSPTSFAPLEVVFRISLLYLVFRIKCISQKSSPAPPPSSLGPLGNCIWYLPVVFGLWGGVFGIWHFPKSYKVYFSEIDSSPPFPPPPPVPPDVWKEI